MSAGGARKVRIAVIGGGFGGLGAAIRLGRAGERDVVVLERADDLGGVWRENDYPGARCDVPSHVYSYSFALNPDWRSSYAAGAEIQGYLRAVAQRSGVLSQVRFGHDVTRAAWDEAAGRWELETTGGRYRADAVVVAAGALSEPAVPELPGFAPFEGTTFHSAAWRHDHDLTGQRVAVIGTGASAIQFVPQIQPVVDRLHLFQRTPPWVLPLGDRRTTAAERRLLRTVPGLLRLVRVLRFWTLEVRVLGFRHPQLMRRAERLARAHLRRQVPDAELRRALTPDYTLGCKRVLLSDDFYPAVTQPNVDLVTTGIREVRARSIVAGDGRELAVDTIIFGTGFRVTDHPIAAIVVGRGGRTLADAWTPHPHAYLGTTVPGFPNLFFMTGPNTGLGHNSIVFMIESQLAYLVDALRVMRERGARTAEVREDVAASFDAELQRALAGRVWTSGGCRSWYLDGAGRNTTLWPDWTWRYRLRTRRFRAEDYVLAA